MQLLAAKVFLIVSKLLTFPPSYLGDMCVCSKASEKLFCQDTGTLDYEQKLMSRWFQYQEFTKLKKTQQLLPRIRILTKLCRMIVPQTMAGTKSILKSVSRIFKSHQTVVLIFLLPKGWPLII